MSNFSGPLVKPVAYLSASYSVASALVVPETSQSLLHALTTCLDPHDFRLPYYHEERMEFEESPFELHGWICHDYSEKEIDDFDPHAGEIAYPPYKISDSIIERFRLSADLEQREWRVIDQQQPSLICELWSESSYDERDKPTKNGNRISASLEFLKNLCSVLNRELIIEVQNKRREYRSYHMESDNDRKAPGPWSKIYLLSGNGTLRDARTRYQLR